MSVVRKEGDHPHLFALFFVFIQREKIIKHQLDKQSECAQVLTSFKYARNLLTMLVTITAEAPQPKTGLAVESLAQD